jgi:hypothetical protein
MSECSDVSTSSLGETTLEKPAIERQTSVSQAEGIASAQTSASTSGGGRSATPEVLLYDKYLSK